MAEQQQNRPAMPDHEQIEQLNHRFCNADPVEVLSYFVEQYKDRIALSSSLSIEDQVLTHMVVQLSKHTRIFTLDTGRLFPETYQLIDTTSLKYGVPIEVFFPDYERVQQMVREEGINLFYTSIESRHRCCQIRKLEPLQRAFKGLDAWICGLRREQSVTRKDMQVVEWDGMHNMIKINPLINWTEQQVWDYIKQNHVPYNKLHDRGYPSIGCEPCTRAIKPGEDVRAGRWWWESPEHRECGLHQRH
ncbi:MAG: phosphoadenylyl-sulfate reductase [Paludibacteraceae bacterium]|nr:phosphoadenylyl-sulfate reductase [Paludibacteraceae bacterium]